MKVAITGHTKGLGKQLATEFAARGFDVVGFSTSNGFDITNKADQERIIRASEDCKIFINNAYTGFAQIQLFYKIHSVWNGVGDKYIYNISSDASYHEKDQPFPYAVTKKALDDAVKQTQRGSRWPRVVLFSPGYIDTDRTKDVKARKLSPKQAADVIMYAYDNRHTFHVKSIVYEPV